MLVNAYNIELQKISILSNLIENGVATIQCISRHIKCRDS